MFRGENVFATADQANEEAKTKGQFSASQHRFYLPPGAQSEIIILDDKITIGAFEHDIPIPGKSYKRYVPCIAAIPGMSCPLCRAGDRRTYRMFATVLDLSEYTTGKGVKVTRSRRLLAINQGDKERWQSIQQDVLKLHGTLRGTYIFMKRPNEQRSARTGEPFAIEGRLWQHMTEPELLKGYGHKAIVEGSKVVKAANEMITCHDYDVIFPFPDEAFIAKLEAEFGNGLPQERAADAEAGDHAKSGSAADVDQAWEEEIQEGAPADEGGAVAIEGLGADADAGNQESAQTLTEVAAEVGVNVEDFPSWAEVEVAITEAREPAPEVEAEPEPAKPAPRPIAKLGPKPGPVNKPGLARPGVKTGLPRPGLVRPAATPAPAPKGPVGLKRPTAPAPLVPRPVAKPGGIVRPNRTAFNG